MRPQIGGGSFQKKAHAGAVVAIGISRRPKFISAATVAPKGNVMKALRILVVEDDAMIAMHLADLLAVMGHDICAIEATKAGAEAAAIQCRPDLMIVDARLGDESGVSAVAEILRTGFVPHVFISGDVSTIRTLVPDAVAIQKPFEESDLIRAIERALGAAVGSLKANPRDAA